jgi:FlaA1/EpsC-like NDP-sugar epimerase
MLEPDWRRQVARLGWDCASWVTATLLVVLTRYDFQLLPLQYRYLAIYAVVACLLQVVVGTAMMLYRGRYRTASFDEIFGLVLTAAIVGAVLAVLAVGAFGASAFPRATAVLVPPLALMSMAGARWTFRAWRGRQWRADQQAERVLIYGAGDAGYQLIRLICTDQQSPYDVVGFIDDAREKRNLRLVGVPVLGQRSQLLTVAAERGVETVILAITEASAEMVREVSDLVAGAGMHFKVLPPVAELLGRRVSLEDVRDVDIADILGRHQVVTDLAGIADYVTGKRVLVTGAGGSIGSELARQVHGFGPSELVLLDRDESGLHGAQLAIYGQGLLDTPDIVLADIRDEQTVAKVFADHRPEVVFHAAALKHLPMLEQYPDEGWKTNVLGTRNVLRAARANGCQRFVNVSTDKAADPTSVLGWTKRTAEQLTAWYANDAKGTYLSVRFGNVLGSRGSMLHTFTTQIRAGGPLTVTHPEVSRYFMTIPEACALVIQAGAVGAPGEVLVLDMGQPVSILAVAKRLIAQSGKKVEIVFTGLRPGEKLHEVLFSGHEHGVRRSHSMITHVAVPPVSPADLADLAGAGISWVRPFDRVGVPAS